MGSNGALYSDMKRHSERICAVVVQQEEAVASRRRFADVSGLRVTCWRAHAHTADCAGDTSLDRGFTVIGDDIDAKEMLPVTRRRRVLWGIPASRQRLGLELN